MLSKIYGRIVAARNDAFDAGKKKTSAASAPVVSVGALSAGGAGKTPFAIFLAKTLYEMGFAPALVGRGYKSAGSGLRVVCDGRKIIAGPREAGDEMYMIAKKLGLPVVVHEKKFVAAQYAAEAFTPDLIIIDDGFQHRRLKRDFDIVLIDEATLANPRLLPKGRLREPFESLRRADAIVFSNCAAPTDFQYSYGAIICEAKTKTGAIYNLFSNKENVDSDRLKRLAAVCGIARPERFFATLDRLGHSVAAKIKFKDHWDYSIRDVSRIVQTAAGENGAIITTEKDAGKLAAFEDIFAANRVKCFVLPAETEIISGGEEFFEKIASFL